VSSDRSIGNELTAFADVVDISDGAREESYAQAIIYAIQAYNTSTVCFLWHSHDSLDALL
jgi:hypothetical protein